MDWTSSIVCDSRTSWRLSVMVLYRSPSVGRVYPNTPKRVARYTFSSIPSPAPRGTSSGGEDAGKCGGALRRRGGSVQLRLRVHPGAPAAPQPPGTPRVLT